jgi:S-adenosylmethionine hydrolase
VIVKTHQAYFIAPDNGVLSAVAQHKEKAVSIENPEYWLNHVSTTFHGRDIFAPVAAHLSAGIPIQEFGVSISSIVTLSTHQPTTDPNGNVIGEVMYIDHFGNLITNIKRDKLPQADFFIGIKDRVINRLSISYAHGAGLLAVVGSDDHLEIAVKDGNAAAYLGVDCGEKVTIITNPET